jgi:transcriptional regulator with XRE-family HTH domain
MFDKKIFAERLKSLRASANLSYAELGAAIGISKVSVHYLEREVNYPHCNTLIALADYFDVSIDYLVGRSDDPARR